MEKTVKTLDVCIQFESMKGYTKRVAQPEDYDSLSAVVRKCLEKDSKGQNSEFRIHSKDTDGLVVVEDDDDLNLAYQIAAQSAGKVVFLVSTKRKAPKWSMKTPQEETKTKGWEFITPDEGHANEGAGEDDEPVEGKKSRRKNNMPKGIPRKAVKQLIESYLSNNAKKIFHEILSDK